MERGHTPPGTTTLHVEASGVHAKELRVVLVHRLEGPHTVDEVVDAVRGFLADLGAVQRVAPHPIRTWREAAQAIGVSVDTLRRLRKKHGVEDLRPYFASEESAVTWYRSLGMTPEVQKPRRRRARRGAGGTTLASVRGQR